MGEYRTLISSAGGRRARITRKFDLTKDTNEAFLLKIRGLKGGHSGGFIDKELGNSNKIATRILYHLQKVLPIRVASIDGGLKDNAIPRECDVIFSCPKDTVDQMKAIVDKVTADVKTVLEFSDEGFYTELESVEITKSFNEKDTKSLIKFMYLLPNGLVAKSMKIPGLTMTSLNLGSVATTEDTIDLCYSLRSAITASIDEMEYQITELCELFDFNVKYDASYPGWNYREENPLRDRLMNLFEEKYGYPMQTVASHGGCECGVFDALLDPVNIISYGCINENVHTPDERMNLDSFVRCFEMLKELLARSL